MRVSLQAPPGRAIIAVAAGPEGSVERAESFLNAPGGPYEDLDPVAWSPGLPFEVRMPCGYRPSFLTGRRLDAWQSQAVVLRLDFADGTRQWLVRPLPSRWVSRELSVVVP